MMDFNQIASHLGTKGTLKQKVYQQTYSFFEILKTQGEETINQLADEFKKNNQHLDLHFSNQGQFESEIRFAGDALVLQMHTNVFAFPEDHFVHKLEPILEDSSKSFCGMILIYNFLADSLRYNRYYDVGYLLGRIFINKDGNFFVQGRRQLSFLFHDFMHQSIDAESARKILHTAIFQAIDFDLLVPPFDDVKTISLQQKIAQMGNTAIKTGKRLGFEYSNQED